jgi:predicted NBD/HSP70 family sugar kinase
MVHEQFQDLLDRLVRNSGVGQEVLGEVLARTSLRAPAETSRVEISAGNPAARRPVDQRAIPQGTVSKAVKALLEDELLEDGEKLLRNHDGRTLSPLRLGSRFAIAGVNVQTSAGQPRQVTTALLGLDTSRELGTAHDPADTWNQVAVLVHRHVASLKSTCDQDRARRGLKPLRMFGVGVAVAAPAYDGQVMPPSGDASGPPVELAAMLRRLFDADTSFDRSVPVVVENDANALAVLASHQVRYAVPDLVVVGVFDEGTGGGLVMDGQLRRGGNRRAMEIGHLAVGFPPGQQQEPQNPEESKAEIACPPTANAGFNARCSCGHFGHVDTLATPSRIRGELGDGTLDQIGAIGSADPGFNRACHVFARSGSALGRALAHVSNTVNPTRMIVYLPAALAEPEPGTAAAAYLTAVRWEAANAFAASDQPDYLTIRALPAEAQQTALLGAKAAAVCVLESFIEHALRLDNCKSGLRRHSTGSHTPAA